jgi:transcriptional regulator with XRE-family HTH domain
MRAAWTHTHAFRSPPFFTGWLLATSSNQRDNVCEFKSLNCSLTTIPMPSNAKFATFITRHRKKLGLTAPQLAEKVGVTKSNVSVWESGQFLPKLSVLERLARALEVSYEELLAKGNYPRHEVGPAEYFRRQGFPQEAVAEAERLYSKLESKYPKRARRRR